MIFSLILSALSGYLLGSVNTALIVSQGKYKDDVRTHGSGNSGSTNMLRTYGKKAALATFIGDFIKGLIAVFLGYVLAKIFNQDLKALGAIAGLFAVIGHDFPLYFGFKGGKGAATTLAVGTMLFPIWGLIIVVLAAAIIALTRYVSLAAMTCMTVFMTYVVIAHHANMILMCCVIAMWALMLARHGSNIKRLLKGEESKVSFKKK